MIGVDSNETSEANAEQLLAAAGATYPVGVDANAKVASRYLVQALPVSYFLDASGKVVGVGAGPTDRDFPGALGGTARVVTDDRDE